MKIIMDNMTLRHLMIESIAQFEMLSGKTDYAEPLIAMSDEELIKRYRNAIYDEGYTDGHVEGYLNGVNEKQKQDRKIDSKARLN